MKNLTIFKRLLFGYLEKTIADSDIEKDICEIMKTVDKKVDTFKEK